MNTGKKYFTRWWFFILLNCALFSIPCAYFALHIGFNRRYGIEEHPLSTLVFILFVLMLGYDFYSTVRYLIVPFKKNEPELPILWAITVFLYILLVFASYVMTGAAGG